MNWIEALYKTYENNLFSVGKLEDGKTSLLPVCHTTNQAQITIVINENSEFLRACVIPSKESKTIIPATEKSSTRTAGLSPHPLFDKLQYVAKDYNTYCGNKKTGYEQYSELLRKWSDFDQNSKLKAVLNYVEKGEVIKNLIDCMIFLKDTENQITKNPDIWNSEWKDREALDLFIRFEVEKIGDPKSELWKDAELWKSWEQYCASTEPTKGLCYVTGEIHPLSKLHPKKIRNEGDGAKIISSNDKDGFTYRGKFTSDDQVCGVGFNVTHKAHSALRWLINRQGTRNDDYAFVAWSVGGEDIPNPLSNTIDLLDPYLLLEENVTHEYTAQEIGIAMNKLIKGYSAKLNSLNKIVAMGIDSASTGRISIVFYRELEGSEFIEKVLNWHKSCMWKQNFSKDKIFFGAPSPRDIVFAAYGPKVDDNLKKSTVKTLVQCIIDNTPIPRGLVESCIRQSTKRHNMEHYEWEKTLGITCAIYRHNNTERNYQMSLETERKTRDYLYGRLLAIADKIEGKALRLSKENRPTNATRFMQRFADRPFTTWRNIRLALLPYESKLRNTHPAFLEKYKKEIDNIMSMFNTEDFNSDQKLTGEFLLGFHCQNESMKYKPESTMQEEVIKEDIIVTQ